MDGGTIWLTGLSGAGKSTIARDVREKLRSRGIISLVLDADEIRAGLNCDLGFSEEDRNENVRRIGELARLIAFAGHFAIVASISPYARSRESVRRRHANDDLLFIEVHVATPIEVCRARDPKKLYAAASAGDIKCFTGVTDVYQIPIAPDVVLPAHELTIDSCSERLIQVLEDSAVSRRTIDSTDEFGQVLTLTAARE